jgi:hypothetical protein
MEAKMKPKQLTWMMVTLALGLLALSACSGASPEEACSPMPNETIPIEEAKLYIEYNFTDADLGVHGAFDDAGWSELCVYDPDGNLVLVVNPQAELGDLTMAGIFFESREPPTEEFSFADLEASFPEGQYEVRAIAFDGTARSGVPNFSHDVPVAPVITVPPLAEDDESAEDAVVSTADLVIEWEDVTETVNGDPVLITAYEVIVTKEEHEDPNGFSRPIFDVHVPPDQNTLAVPVEFLEPDTVYELEVLALEVSGNQTISIGFFQTE